MNHQDTQKAQGRSAFVSWCLCGEALLLGAPRISLRGLAPWRENQRDRPQASEPGCPMAERNFGP